MIIFAACVLSVVLQQPAPRPAQPPRPNAARPSSVVARPSSPSQPTTPYDSTVGALTDIGTKVAEVRSTYDLYRRAAFNDPNGALVERAALYRTNCRALSDATRQGERRICHSCLPRNVQAVVDRYRAHLPALRTVAEQCASRIDRLRARGNENVVAAAMRADVRAEGGRLVTGLRPYEERVTDVRRVMGWDQQPIVPTPRRGN
jgi:hypothetical protein